VNQVQVISNSIISD